MNTAERLRQLREQHQLVSRHLAWLESEIARAETSEETGYTPTGPSAATPPPPAVASVEEPFIEPGPSAAEHARRSRLGCILASVVGAAILLFLIWGLPQFLY